MSEGLCRKVAIGKRIMMLSKKREQEKGTTAIVFGTAVAEAADLNLGLFFWTATGF